MCAPLQIIELLLDVVASLLQRLLQSVEVVLEPVGLHPVLEFLHVFDLFLLLVLDEFVDLFERMANCLSDALIDFLLN